MDQRRSPAADLPVDDHLTDLPLDLPIAVRCREPLHSEITTWLESDVGWQVVSGSGPLRPVAMITDDDDDAAGAVLVIPQQGGSGQAASGTAQTAAQTAARAPAGAPRRHPGGAAAVVAWPRDRDQIVTAVREVVSTPPRPSRARAASARKVLRIAGAGGGVGTSTVTWTLAALATWRGARALVVGCDDLLCLAGLPAWSGPDVGDLAQLGPADVAPETAAHAIQVPGVEGLAVLGAAARDRAHSAALVGMADATGWPFDVVVADVGRDVEQADVVVAEPDARVVAAGIPAGRLVLRLPGPLSRSEASRLIAGRPRGWIDEDPRVRRAGAEGRVPTALPGRWVRATCASVAGSSRPRERGRR